MPTSVCWNSVNNERIGSRWASAVAFSGYSFSSSSAANFLNAAAMAPSSTSTSSPVKSSSCCTAWVSVLRPTDCRGENSDDLNAGLFDQRQLHFPSTTTTFPVLTDLFYMAVLLGREDH